MYKNVHTVTLNYTIYAMSYIYVCTYTRITHNKKVYIIPKYTYIYTYKMYKHYTRHLYKSVYTLTNPGWRADTVTPFPVSLLCRASAVMTCRMKWETHTTEIISRIYVIGVKCPYFRGTVPISTTLSLCPLAMSLLFTHTSDYWDYTRGDIFMVIFKGVPLLYWESLFYGYIVPTWGHGRLTPMYM